MKTLRIFVLVFLCLLEACVFDLEPQKEEPKPDLKDIKVSINIDNNEKNVATSKKITIDFSGKVFKLDGREVDDKNVKEIVSFRENSLKGKAVLFDVDINSKGRITIKPNVLLRKSTRYYLGVDGKKLKGGNGEKVLGKEILFTTQAAIVYPLNIKDPLYKDQWYLKNTGQYGGTAGLDIKIEPVWKQGYTGKGMHIAILDQPFPLIQSKAHEDLKDNQNFTKSYNYFPFDYKNDGDTHGLNSAGIIAAVGNDIGLRGIAYESKIYTYGILSAKPVGDEAPDAVKRILQIPEIAVINNSWGTTNITLNSKYRAALEEGLEKGFYGRGIVHVHSAGNDASFNNSTLEGQLNYYGAVVVNSLDYNGANTEKGERFKFNGIYYRTAIGANLWVAAPGFRMTTTGSDNPRKRGYLGYKDNYAATSSAGPVVTGIVALIRQANPNLTWRDVKLILAESTIKNDPAHKDWKKGYAKKSNSGAYFYFNHNYGFGMVNAEKAIALSKKWTNLPPMKTKTFSSADLDITVNSTKKDNTITVQNSGINFIESVVIEITLEKKVNVERTDKFDLKLTHKSTVSHLYMEGKKFFSFDKAINKITFKMLTNAHLGGSADGSWKISIKDTEVFTKLKKWKLIIRGH